MPLFADSESRRLAAAQPLAARMRPRTLDEFAGQQHLLGEGKLLRRLIKADRLASVLFYGPPGTGKTTLARLLAEAIHCRFRQLNAVTSGVKELREVLEEARGELATGGRRTLLFVDEIHRFNRAQQDGFLPYVEDGTVILVGATTENPSFELNAALLSRAQIFVLNRLDDASIEKLLARAEQAEGRRLPLDADARRALRAMADGDGRYVLNMAEELFALPAGKQGDSGLLDVKALTAAVQKRAPPSGR